MKSVSRSVANHRGRGTADAPIWSENLTPTTMNFENIYSVNRVV